ncbi:MAG: hypothetical protein ACK4RK_05015 [Gemmataceae bacterium]
MPSHGPEQWWIAVVSWTGRGDNNKEETKPKPVPWGPAEHRD